MMFRELRGMEIGTSKEIGAVAPGVNQTITRAPNGWIWTTFNDARTVISSVFVPEKRFKKREGAEGSSGR